MKQTIAIIVLALLLLGSVVYNVRLSSDSGGIGSVVTGQEYDSAPVDYLGINSSQLIKGGYGSLAQVTVTGAGTSGFTLYNATTTNFAEVTTKSSSTQKLAVIPASLVAGTYTFDVTFTDGLYIYFDTVGTAPTTTISYR